MRTPFGGLLLAAAAGVALFGHGVESRADSRADTLKDYYRDFRRMDDRQLRAELTLMWYTTLGGAYYNVEERVSGDCAKTASAAAYAWLRLHTVERTSPLVADALRQATAEARSTTVLVHPVEIVCRQLERSLQRRADVYAAFARLKEGGGDDEDAAGNATDGGADGRSDYLKPPPPSPDTLRNAYDYMNAFNAFWLGMPRVGQIVAHAAFVQQLVAPSTNCSAEHRLARAVVELAKRDELRRPTQRLYERALRRVVRLVLERIAEEASGEAVPALKTVRDTLPATLKAHFDAEPRLAAELAKTMARVGADGCAGAE